MMKHFLIQLLLLVSPLFAAEIRVIPKPAQVTLRDGTFSLSRKATISAPLALANEVRQLSGFLSAAADPLPAPTRGEAADITLRLDPKLSDLGAEGYLLRVTLKGVLIDAAEPAGVFYGIQTLRQLLPVEIDAPHQAGNLAWEVPCVEIRDVPRFGWRGFMLDSCRHFQSVATVKQVIDLMARQKLNRLHWHLSEDDAWRIEVPGYPELTSKGAWRSGREDGKDVARYGGFYSVREVREIVDYARQRHVLVYPELEMPGHSTAAIHVYPQFSCDGKPVVPGAPGELGITSYSAEGRRAFCPSRPETYAFLENVAMKVSELFQTPYLHIGADEVPREQWDKCTRCRAFIEKEGLKDNIGLQQYFSRRMSGFVRKNGKQPIFWGVDLDHGIPEGIIVQGWHSGESALAARKGFTTINSDCGGTYFDFPAGPGDTGDGSKWLGKLPIEAVYRFDPMPAGLTPAQASLVIGSEAALWTEYVPEHKLMSKIFPRLFAFAEIVWSEPQGRDFKEFQQRLAPQLQRLDLMQIPHFGQQPGGLSLGTWSPAKLNVGDVTLDWDASAVIRPAPGRYRTTFLFQRGQHALEIRSVTLLRDGVEISRDQHDGLAGGRHENNSFLLAVTDTKPGRFSIRATVAGLGGIDSNGEIRISPAPADAGTGSQ